MQAHHISRVAVHVAFDEDDGAVKDVETSALHTEDRVSLQ